LTDKTEKDQILVSKEVWREINTKVIGERKTLTLQGFGRTEYYNITGIR
jgi:hypothetical protein